MTGGRGLSVWRFSIHALSASSGRSVGSMPSASAARCGLVVALVKMRKPRGKSGDALEQQGRAVRHPGRHLGDGADLEAGIGAFDAPQRSELVDEVDELPQILVHAVGPGRCSRHNITIL